MTRGIKMGKEKGKDPSTELYSKLTKEADRLEAENGKKANVIQKAYAAAVSELGYSDKQLMDEGKAKKVAKLMFSDRYLGNAQFNPLLKETPYAGFAQKTDVDKQRDFEHMLGMNMHSFVATGGVIDRHGGLRRGSITEAVERHYNSDVAQRLNALAWQQLYNPEASLGDRIASYAGVLHQDPILAASRAKVSPSKFDSVDDITQALTTSAMGRSSREMMQHKYGAQFN
jgi:hypothetical protein